MRLKSTLWALAFACAAMSCSDDLENGSGNKNNNGKKGETALINVAISSGPVTKATAGENGDEFEAGSEDESAVDNVMLILYKKTIPLMATRCYLTARSRLSATPLRSANRLPEVP